MFRASDAAELFAPLSLWICENIESVWRSIEDRAVFEPWQDHPRTALLVDFPQAGLSFGWCRILTIAGRFTESFRYAYTVEFQCTLLGNSPLPVGSWFDKRPSVLSRSPYLRPGPVTSESRGTVPSSWLPRRTSRVPTESWSDDNSGQRSFPGTKPS